MTGTTYQVTGTVESIQIDPVKNNNGGASVNRMRLAITIVPPVGSNIPASIVCWADQGTPIYENTSAFSVGTAVDVVITTTGANVACTKIPVFTFTVEKAKSTT